LSLSFLSPSNVTAILSEVTIIPSASVNGVVLLANGRATLYGASAATLLCYALLCLTQQ
jgi:hypothetical protein